MDNTAGIQWFGEWTDRDIYGWNFEDDRALYTRLLDVETYEIDSRGTSIGGWIPITPPNGLRRGEHG